MKRLFTIHKWFAVFFFAILFIDIYVKLYCPVFPYRFISKPFVILLLFAYYYLNKSENNKQNLWTFLGMISFLLGDLTIINHTDIVFLGVSLFFFSIGKIFFCLRFSHKGDFNISRLVPFSIILFLYAVFMISIVFKGLKGFLVPGLLSFFLSLLMFQFAYLRKGVFNKMSYSYVFFGVMVFIVSENIMAIKTFRNDLPYQDFLIMLFYGVSMYFIVLGIIKERSCEVNLS